MRHKGRKLKLKVIERGMVQADVAEEAQISESWLSRIVNERARTTPDERTRLAAALKISGHELEKLLAPERGDENAWGRTWKEVRGYEHGRLHRPFSRRPPMTRRRRSSS